MATLTLDYASQQVVPPLEPTPDDQSTTNKVVMTRTGGGSHEAEVTSGALSTQDPPDGVGIYDRSVEVNVRDDLQLPDGAGFVLHHGTWDEDRYPTISALLRQLDTHSLAGDAQTLDLGDRIIIQNPPTWLPPEDIDQLTLSYTESITPGVWRQDWHTEPSGPLLVGVWADGSANAPGPATPQRRDTSGSETVAAITSGTDTSVEVTTTAGPLWGVTGDSNMDFPLDVRCSGCRLRVTGIADPAADAFGRTETDTWGTADSGQAWTGAGGADSDRAVGSGVGTLTLATDSTTERFQVLGDTSAWTDVELLFTVSTSATATGATLGAGALLRYVSTSEFYYARVHFTTTGSVFLSVTNSALGSGQVGTNQDSGYDYSATDQFRVRARIAGQTVAIKLWPVADPEPSLWQISRTVTTSTITAGSAGLAAAGFSGNTNTDPVISFDGFAVVNPQTFTISRTVPNGVAKTIAGGTAVSLWTKAVRGL